MNDCFICKKHKTFSEYTGEIIAERGGLILTHFPRLEDEKTTKGHLILEPRRHVTELSELNEEEASNFGGLLASGVACIKAQLNAEHVYVFRLNDKVAHLHFHLVPRYPNTPREHWGFKIWDWPERETITLEQVHEVARKLKAGMSPPR